MQAQSAPLWTPSKMATDWCTENCNHGNQLFGKFSAGGGGGRRNGPVSVYSQTHTLTDRQTDTDTGHLCGVYAVGYRKDWKMLTNGTFIQPSCIRFNPSPSSHYLSFSQNPCRQSHPLLFLFSLWRLFLCLLMSALHFAMKLGRLVMRCRVKSVGVG